MALTREQILGVKPKVMEIGPVPGWDGNVFIRQIGVKDRNEWASLRMEALAQAEEDGKAGTLAGSILASRLVLVAASLCDEDGALLFSREEVAGMDPHAVDYVADQAEKLNGLTKEATDELEGNSETPQPGSGSTN